MTLLGFVYIFFFNILLKVLAGEYTPLGLGQDGFDLFTEGLTVCDSVYNIFAWIDFFVDVDLCLSLFLLTSLFYSIKFAIRLAKFVLGFFKR